jgi:hypothetical protein
MKTEIATWREGISAVPQNGLLFFCARPAQNLSRKYIENPKHEKDDASGPEENAAMSWMTRPHAGGFGLCKRIRQKNREAMKPV